MTIDGANQFHDATDYIIYTMNSATTGQYCMVLPKNIGSTLNMLIDLHMKNSFDAVSSGTKTKEQLVEKISREYLNLKTKYPDGMLIFPMFSEEFLVSTIASGDKQKMFDETKKIGAITSELYKKLTDAGVENQKIDQKIIIVEKNEEDQKYVEWLKVQMPNFVDGVDYKEFEKKEVVEPMNPFMSENPFAPVPPVAQSPVEPKVQSNSIFDQVVSNPTVAPAVTPNVTPEVPVPPVAPASTEEVTSASPSTDSFDIFGTPLNSVPNQNPNPINIPTETPVAPQVPEQSSNLEIPKEEGPKPVSNVELEGTTTFSPIAEPQVEKKEEVVAENASGEVTEERKSSKGFANLLILCVILIGVTLASVELGKFLYSVYGA